ncbi:MAG: outer membrane protein assembly factor BamD [Gammaproteobacteria bacterium]|nr:outer membrane protein assembly factor BamD [Gammaproteobacteria bacterium]
MHKHLFSVLLLAVLLAGCASTPDDELDDADADKTAAILYNEANDSLHAGDYETAISRLESLEARFPFGRYAQQAQLDIAYAYYKYDEPDSAVSALDRFIKLYPRHPRVDYAYYLRGLVKFEQGRGVFDNLPGQDPAKRDPGAAKQAFQFFDDLVSHYPNSIYAADAVERMRYLRNSLARYEIYVGEYYFRRGAYLAAANRGKQVLEYFGTTPSVPDALVLMIKSYEKLQLPDLAADAQRVLKKNFPKHKTELAALQ